eukprot:gene1538-biopygen1333
MVVPAAQSIRFALSSPASGWTVHHRFLLRGRSADVRASLLRIDRTERKEGLAVEIDGPVHADRQEHDDRRTAWLAKEDIQVLRFSTTEIETGPAAVLKAIAQAAPPSTA